LRQIGLAPQGLFIYLDQEGRGHGLSTKVRAMNWKAAGRDTFEAVESLGLAADNRSYEMLPDMLRELDIVSIDLMTNNPDKAVAIAATGVVVRRVVACIAPNPPVQSLRHLDAKRRRGHKL
jgi:GTP cyclohydrolase II